MANKKQTKRELTRKEVSNMLGHLPTNDTDLLELMLDVLINAADDYPEVNLEKLTDAMLDIDEGYRLEDGATDRVIKAKKYIQKCSLKLWVYIDEQFKDLYGSM